MRARPLLAALIVLLATLLPVQVVALVRRPGAPRAPVAAAPSPSPSPSPTPTVVASPSPSASATPRRTRPRAAPERRVRGPAVFRGLGAWVDVYDFDLDPAASVAVMRAHGVRTLYIQTGRYNTPHDVAPEVAPWLERAHDAGIEVVGWYLPSYRRMAHDVRRMVAVATYRSPRGDRFDAAGIDIESRAEVRDVQTWNDRVAEHARLVRARLPRRYPLASITPTPLGMGVAPHRWFGFPWQRLARVSDAFLLMSYWSYRNDCERVRSHCAYGYTRDNVERVRALAGRMPIHVIGGVGDSVSATEIRDFVRGARDARAFGASVYDFRTTESAFWPLLRRLRSL